MAADRPDAIETPQTVDAGHFQVETSVASYTKDAANSYSFLSTMLKAGLLRWCDLELSLEPFLYETGRGRFGDWTPRFKANFWGNDGGRFAAGSIVFAAMPAKEGGIIFPFAYDLSEKWGLAFQTELDIVANAAATGHDLDFINLAGVTYGLTESLSVFSEFFSQISREGNPWAGRVDVGATYRITDNFSMDGAVYIGITEAAEDFNPFVGFSWQY